MDNKTTTKIKTKIEKVNIDYLTFDKEIISNAGIDEEYILRGHGKEFKISLKFNEDRGKFLVNIGHDGRTQSLSFFSRKGDANINIETYIISIFGKRKQIGS